MKKWWKETVVYQIYPRSFFDYNNDGIGDIKGITEKLDYIKNLGIDTIWLSPVYKSANDDNGYDISDYFQIMEDFGSIKDWETMLNGIHKRGMKLVMDLVVNHTSDEHTWFAESKSSKDSQKRDYYIWRPAKDGHEPNNWQSFFSESAWEYDATTNEYYLHLFSKKQPDLNWNNPKVKEEIFGMMKWWLDKGIDGFRMDVINVLSKPKGLPDSKLKANRGEKFVFDCDLYANEEGNHTILKDMNKQVLSKYDVMTVGETPEVTPEVALKFVAEDRKELNMVFSFDHLDWDDEDIPYGKVAIFFFLIRMIAKKIIVKNKKIDLLKYKEILSSWYSVIEKGGWNSQYMSNHDQPRQVSRFGDDKKYHARSAKMLATLLHTLPGTPYVYQGEEIGMTNIALPKIEDYRDIGTINAYKLAIQKGIPKFVAIKGVHEKSRDNARTPMQWNSKENGGFSTHSPWLAVNPNYSEINVEKQENDAESILNFYREIISMRKKHEVMIYGDFNILNMEDKKVMAYTRQLDNERWLIIANFSHKKAKYNLPANVEIKQAKVLLSNILDYQLPSSDYIKLEPYQAMILSI